MRGSMPRPASIDLRVAILAAIFLIRPNRNDGVSHCDAFARTWTYALGADLPRRWIERFSDIGFLNASRSLEREGVTSDAIARVPSRGFAYGIGAEFP